jgi:hypothetical protein
VSGSAQHEEAAASRLDERAARHEKAARDWLARGDAGRAEMECRCAEIERTAAELRRRRATAVPKP